MISLNKKNLKVVGKLFECGFATEKDISSLGVDEILKIPGITISDIQVIADLQKAIKVNKILTFFSADEDSNEA